MAEDNKIKNAADIDAVFTGTQGKPAPWRDRKRAIIATLTFCAMCVLYILVGGKDLAIYQTIVLGCFGLAGSTLGFFIAGQTWHDINVEKIDTVRRINGVNEDTTGNVNMPTDKDVDER